MRKPTRRARGVRQVSRSNLAPPLGSRCEPMRILITRPVEDAEAIAARLAELGHDTVVAPLLTIRYLDRAVPLEGVQAILATSANGVRAFSRLSARRDLPLFAVGPQTAEEARRAG